MIVSGLGIVVCYMSFQVLILRCMQEGECMCVRGEHVYVCRDWKSSFGVVPQALSCFLR